MNKKVNFNKYSNDYIDIMNKQHSKYGDIEYYSQHKAKITKSFINYNIENILEFGCGVGRNLPFLKNEFLTSNLYASDISVDSLKIAQNNNSTIKFIQDEELMDYKENFDLIFIAGVYHHIAPELREDITEKVVSLLRPKGKLICFEHNPYNPLTRHMVNTCEFDKDAILMNVKEVQNVFMKAGLFVLKSSYTLFVPPKLKRFNFIEPYFSWLPFGGQHYVIFMK